MFLAPPVVLFGARFGCATLFLRSRCGRAPLLLDGVDIAAGRRRERRDSALARGAAPLHRGEQQHRERDDLAAAHPSATRQMTWHRYFVLRYSSSAFFSAAPSDAP
jgi:hypothetical protein